MDIFLFLIIISIGIFIGYCFATRSRHKNETKVMMTPIYKETTTKDDSSLEMKLKLEDAIGIIEKLGETISSSMDLNDLAKEIVESTCRILNVEICALLLLDETTDILSVIASIGIEDKFANAICIKKGEEISGVVAKYNEMQVIDNLGYYNLKYDKCYKNYLVSLPMSIKNRVLGVLNVSNPKSNNPFYPIDIEIIKVIALEGAFALQNLKLFHEQNKNYLNTIIALAAAIDARDPYTYQHSNNVTQYAIRIAQEMKFSVRELEDIRYAALLHDIGKIGIKDEILRKPGKLTEEEYLQIKTHPIKGEEIVKSLTFLQGITKIIRHHHERFDGKGYPDGIKGENIELGAKILALADSIDAMASNRLYRKALSLDASKNELINNKGVMFDPYIVDIFLQILEKEPNFIKNPESSS